MRRRTLDALLTTGGLVLAALLLVAGGLLTWATCSSTTRSTTSSPPRRSSSRPATRRRPGHQPVPQPVRRPAAHQRRAGRGLRQPLHRRAPQGVGGGKTYAQLSAEAMANPTDAKLPARSRRVQGRDPARPAAQRLRLRQDGPDRFIAAIAAFVGAGMHAAAEPVRLRPPAPGRPRGRGPDRPGPPSRGRHRLTAPPQDPTSPLGRRHRTPVPPAGVRSCFDPEDTPCRRPPAALIHRLSPLRRPASHPTRPSALTRTYLRTNNAAPPTRRHPAPADAEGGSTWRIGSFADHLGPGGWPARPHIEHLSRPVRRAGPARTAGDVCTRASGRRSASPAMFGTRRSPGRGVAPVAGVRGRRAPGRGQEEP